MESTPYQRLEVFWQSKGLKNMSAFAEAVKLSPGTLSAMKQRGSQPTHVVMGAVLNTFPDLNPEYVLFGRGPMLKDDRALNPAPTPTPSAAAEPAPAYLAAAASDVVGKLLDQLTQQRQGYEKQLQQADKNMDAFAKHMQYTIDDLARQRDELKLENENLKQELYELRTAGQAQPQEVPTQEARRAKVKGLRNYDEDPQPQLAEMTATKGDAPLEPFTWQPDASEPSPLHLAA